MQDAWISGTASAVLINSSVRKESASSGDRPRVASISMCRTGHWPHISLANGEGSVASCALARSGPLQDGKIEIEKGALDSPVAAYEISGTVSLGRVMDFKLIAGAEGKSVGAGSLVYSITGTVAEPHVALIPSPETQAQLKP